jgi:hypothetical protein
MHTVLLKSQYYNAPAPTTFWASLAHRQEGAKLYKILAQCRQQVAAVRSFRQLNAYIVKRLFCTNICSLMMDQ